MRRIVWIINDRGQYVKSLSQVTEFAIEARYFDKKSNAKEYIYRYGLIGAVVEALELTGNVIKEHY